MEKKIQVSDKAGTQNVARELARALVPGNVILLEGALGAGKTTFVQALAAELGVTQAVKSPTFTMLWEYDVPGHHQKLYHFDLYRLSPGDSTENIGLDEVLARRDGIIAIEWADRMTVLPHGTLVTIERISDDARLISINSV